MRCFYDQQVLQEMWMVEGQPLYSVRPYKVQMELAES